ncbi:putative tail assembly protein [Escherichia coli]|nr:putative tail assembly protein [Escherichia coli]
MNTAAEAIRALSMQMPGFRRQMNEGWYQIRIRGEDTAPEAVYARLHEQLGEGTVIHIVPRLAGAGKGGLQIVLGAAAIVGSFFTAGASMALWGSALAAGGFSATTMLFSLGASMILGGVAQMLAPKAKVPEYKSTDNGRQNTYFSSLDNMIAQGKFRCVPHLTGRRFEHGVTDCYTLFRDACHLAGIDMPDFEREDDWWRNGQNLYLDNMAVTGFYRVPLSSAQAGDILLCCFGASVPNHAAIYCGNGELLHHLPEQLSKRERYSEKWQRRTHSVWRHRHWHASAFTGICNDLAAASACT